MTKAFWGSFVFLMICRGAIAETAILYTANRQGEVDPCGCQIKNLGGLSQMAERIAQIKKMGSPLFLDAGNAFFSGPRMNPDRKDLENARADLIARSYQLMGLAAFSPGEGDFSAGGDRFWQLIKKTGALAVSANLEENKGRGTFKPYLVWSGGGIKILVTGLTAFNASVIPDGIQEKPARAALKALWKDVEAQKPDQVVVLSHLGRTEDEKIAREFPGVFIVGSKSLDFLLEPLKLGNSFVFEVGIQGQRLGEIVLEKGKAGPTTAKLTELGMEYDKPNGVKKLIQEFKKKKPEKP